MKTGWIQLKGTRCYLKPNSNGYMGSCYINCTLTIDGKEYTFDANGHMLETSLVSNKCIDFVKSWEGFYSTPYKDEVGVLAFGYGMKGDEIVGIKEITKEEAIQMLKYLFNNKHSPVAKTDLDSKGVVSLKQNEFDALVSFAYNCGTADLLGSTLYKNVVAGIRDKYYYF